MALVFRYILPIIVSLSLTLVAISPIPIWHKSEEPGKFYWDSEKSYVLTPWGYGEYSHDSPVPGTWQVFPYAFVGILSFLAISVTAYGLVRRYSDKRKRLIVNLLSMCLTLMMIGLKTYLITWKESQILPEKVGYYSEPINVLPIIIALFSQCLVIVYECCRANQLSLDEKRIRKRPRSLSRKCFRL